MMNELKSMKERENPSYKQIIDQTHSRIEETRLKDDYLEIKLMHEQLKRNLDEEKEKNSKLERQNERLQDKLETVKQSSFQDKEKVVKEFKETVREPLPVDDNRDLIFQL